MIDDVTISYVSVFPTYVSKSLQHEFENVLLINLVTCSISSSP